jgi:hypothetical protein
MVAEATLGSPQSQTAGMTVLVVEDNPDAALSMAMLVNWRGCSCYFSRSRGAGSPRVSLWTGLLLN